MSRARSTFREVRGSPLTQSLYDTSTLASGWDTQPLASDVCCHDDDHWHPALVVVSGISLTSVARREKHEPSV